MKKHFVIFFSPGTFVSETNKQDIDSWDIEKATEMAREIKQRHGATPYGFQFITMERGEEDLDSKETERSNTYYLGGKVLTLDEIKAKDNPSDRVLISNMENNGWDRVIENCNSWKITRPLMEADKVLSFTP